LTRGIHYGDAFIIEGDLLKAVPGFAESFGPGPDRHLWTVEEVAAETEKLALQLAKRAKTKKKP